MNIDPYVHLDAAYALGALDADDRAAYEAHLPTCAACRERLAEARATVAAMSAMSVIDAGDLDEPVDPAVEQLPDTLLPGLLRKARTERRRRATVMAVLGGVAAACVVALAVALWPTSEAPAPPQRRFVAVQSAPVEASAMLVSREWGTQINVECRYTRNLQQGTAYRLVVIDTAQQRFDAGGWTLGRDTTEFTGGTQVRRSDIAKVEITLGDGRPILALTP